MVFRVRLDNPVCALHVGLEGLQLYTWELQVQAADGGEQLWYCSLCHVAIELDGVVYGLGFMDAFSFTRRAVWGAGLGAVVNAPPFRSTRFRYE